MCFSGGAGAGVASPTLPTLGTILGISPFVGGLILSINRFTRLLMNTPAGQIIDTVGTRRPMIIGFVLQGITPFGYILGLHPDLVPGLDAVTIFLIARAVWGFGSTMVFVGAFSIIVHVTSEEIRGRWIGYFRGRQSVGIPAGLVLGGVLTDIYSYEVAFFVAGTVSFLPAVVASLVIPDVVPTVEYSAKLRNIPHLIRADTRILAIGSVNFTVRFLFIGVLASMIVLYAQHHGIEIGSFSAVGVSGVILAVAFVFSSATTLVSGRLSDRMESRALIKLPALGLFAFGFILLGVLPKLEAIFVAIAAIGIGVGGTNPPLMAFLGDISPEADMGKNGGRLQRVRRSGGYSRTDHGTAGRCTHRLPR